MMSIFDKLLNKKIGKTEISPSSGLWAKIEAELDKGNKKGLLIPFWASPIFKQAMAASVIFLLGGIATYTMLDNENQQYVENNSTTKEVVKNNSASNNKINNNNTIAKNIVFENKGEEQSKTKQTKKTVKIAKTEKIKITSSTPNNKKLLSFDYFFGGKTNKSTNANNGNESLANNNNKMSAKDYVWLFDKKTNAYEVVLRENYNRKNQNQFQQEHIEEVNLSPNYMLLNKSESEEVKEEILEIEIEDDSYKQFKTKRTRLNYRGLWLGPNVGYNSVFAGKEHYAGASFGVDLGYDFGGSFGLQSGVFYSLNFKDLKDSYKSEFNAVHIPLMARYKFTSISDSYAKPLSLNLLAGLDYSFVDRKSLHQLGFVVGAEYDVFTQADLMYTFGLRGGAYNNLNLEKADFPEKLNRFNYSLNAYLSVRFIDWAKRK